MKKKKKPQSRRRIAAKPRTNPPDTSDGPSVLVPDLPPALPEPITVVVRPHESKFADAVERHILETRPPFLVLGVDPPSRWQRFKEWIRNL